MAETRSIPLFALPLVIVLCLNISQLAVELTSTVNRPSRRDAPLSGVSVTEFRSDLTGQTHAGYLTDRDLDKFSAKARFSRAQYVLAPVVLDPTSAAHEFLLLDYTARHLASQKIRELEAVPVKKNEEGVLLVRIPRGGTP